MTLKIETPLTLPCGLVLPNRLAKAAMAEDWAGSNNFPHEKFIDTYGVWADGDWGLVMTGNVQVDINHLGQRNDIALREPGLRAKQLEAWKKWSAVTNKNGTPTIVQINHPGRQSTVGAGHRGFFGQTIAPSVVPVNLGSGWLARAAAAFVFGTPREMTKEDIAGVVADFADAAKMSYEAGFAGVEIHAAHGYLLAQFMSAKTNLRTDEYGGSPKNRSRIIVEVIEAIRKVVPKTFCVGIKFNSVDHQSQTELAKCIEQLEDIVDAGVDFLEISGGTYEDPIMVTGESLDSEEKPKEAPAPKASTVAREAFFLEFAQAIRDKFDDIPLMVTGGFRTRQGMEKAIADGACDLVGLGRPAVLTPDLPKKIIFNKNIPDAEAKVKTVDINHQTLADFLGLKFLARGTEVVWYGAQLRNILSVYRN